MDSASLWAAGRECQPRLLNRAAGDLGVPSMLTATEWRSLASGINSLPLNSAFSYSFSRTPWLHHGYRTCEAISSHWKWKLWTKILFCSLCFISVICYLIGNRGNSQNNWLKINWSSHYCRYPTSQGIIQHLQSYHTYHPCQGRGLLYCVGNPPILKTIFHNHQPIIHFLPHPWVTPLRWPVHNYMDIHHFLNMPKAIWQILPLSGRL